MRYDRVGLWTCGALQRQRLGSRRAGPRTVEAGLLVTIYQCGSCGHTQFLDPVSIDMHMNSDHVECQFAHNT